MLTNKQVRMLTILDKQVSSCTKCLLSRNGTAIPYWNRHSKYAIIGEAPGYNEIRQKTPFVGKAGKILTDNLANLGFTQTDFLIINSTQCRPINNLNINKNGKPEEKELDLCQDYLRKYIKVVDPEKILCLGNYSRYMFNGRLTGILKERGVFREYKIEGGKKYPVLFTVHPAYCIYQEEGLDLLKEDLLLFKESNFERADDFFLTEDDFKL